MFESTPVAPEDWSHRSAEFLAQLLGLRLQMTTATQEGNDVVQLPYAGYRLNIDFLHLLEARARRLAMLGGFEQKHCFEVDNY